MAGNLAELKAEALNDTPGDVKDVLLALKAEALVDKLAYKISEA